MKHLEFINEVNNLFIICFIIIKFRVNIVSLINAIDTLIKFSFHSPEPLLFLFLFLYSNHHPIPNSTWKLKFNLI